MCVQQVLMTDLVVAADGHMYEMAAIGRYLSARRAVSPTSLVLTPSHKVRRAIAALQVAAGHS